MKFPWQSKVMLEHPWLMVALLLCLALLGSIITWLRQRKPSNDETKDNVEAKE